MPTITATDLARHPPDPRPSCPPRRDHCGRTQPDRDRALVPAEPAMNAAQALAGLPMIGAEDAARWLRQPHWLRRRSA